MDKRGPVFWAFALASVLVLAAAFFPALAEAPHSQIVKPVATCDAKNCTISRADFQMLQEFHAFKFREIEAANAAIAEAQNEIAKLRHLLTRLGGSCGERRRI